MGMGFAPTWLRQVSPHPLLHMTTLTTAFTFTCGTRTQTTRLGDVWTLLGLVCVDRDRFSDRLQIDVADGASHWVDVTGCGQGIAVITIPTLPHCLRLGPCYCGHVARYQFMVVNKGRRQQTVFATHITAATVNSSNCHPHVTTSPPTSQLLLLLLLLLLLMMLLLLGACWGRILQTGCSFCRPTNNVKALKGAAD